MDMSEAFQKGAAEELPAAAVTFDRFHVIKLVGEAVDEVRRLERSEQPELKNSRYAFLKNPANLSASQFERLLNLSELNLKTMKAYQMRLNLQEAWAQPDAERARRLLVEWCGWVRRAARLAKGQTKSGLEPMARAARTIRAKMRGILNYFRRRRTGGVIEGLNSIVQAARARARGYRSPETFKTMIYLIAGRLQLNLPALTHWKQRSAGNLADGLMRLRNRFGTGHGHHPQQKGLRPRHARLVAGSSASLAVFRWETYVARVGRPTEERT